MLEERYPYVADNSHLNFEFVSEGKMGSIHKVVSYSKTVVNGVNAYNLGFGDVCGSGYIDDKAISNNGDMTKVLNTVAHTVYDFAAHHLYKWIFAEGSTPMRTILYQRKITHVIDKINSEFDVYGLADEGWEEFEKGKNYKSFLVKKK